jgi:hypothetical protein
MQNLDDLAAQRPRRSKAWLYYAVLAVLALIATFGHPLMVFVVLGLGLYSRYLYRGGAVVIWFW